MSGNENSQPVENTQDTILLAVEDNDLDVELLRFYLRRIGSGIPVVRAHHGEEALNILQTAFNSADKPGRFTILLDLNMPRMTGLELLEAIHTEPWFKQLDIYICTTSDQPSDRSRASRFGVKDYLVKPVTPTLLKQILDSDHA